MHFDSSLHHSIELVIESNPRPDNSRIEGEDCGAQNVRRPTGCRIREGVKPVSDYRNRQEGTILSIAIGGLGGILTH